MKLQFPGAMTIKFGVDPFKDSFLVRFAPLYVTYESSPSSEATLDLQVSFSCIASSPLQFPGTMTKPPPEEQGVLALLRRHVGSDNSNMSTCLHAACQLTQELFQSTCPHRQHQTSTPVKVPLSSQVTVACQCHQCREGPHLWFPNCVTMMIW